MSRLEMIKLQHRKMLKLKKIAFRKMMEEEEVNDKIGFDVKKLMKEQTKS